MFDLLSLAEMNKELLGTSDIIVLNSIAFVKDIEKYLNSYSHVSLYLDNDGAGRKAAKCLTDNYTHITDYSSIYNNYKDLNEFLQYGYKI